MGTDADSRRRRRFVAAAVALPVALAGLAECALRICGVGAASGVTNLEFVHPEFADEARAEEGTLPDAVLFWRLRPGFPGPGVPEPTPPSGYRTQFDVAKREGVDRIVCVGDSNTFGFGVARENAWPAVLASGFGMLPEDRTWEVLSLGVPGYTSWQVRRLVETEVAALSPSVVTVEVGAFNEWLPAVGRVDRDQGAGRSGSGLRIVDVLADALRPRASAAEIEAARAFRSSEYRGLRRVPVADFEDDLDAIAGWCGAHGVRAVFVAHPLPARTVEFSPIALEYADAVRRVAARAGVALVDGWQVFRASGRRDDELFLDFCHPTPTGHRLLAHAVGGAVRGLR